MSDARPARLAALGSPISHSLSPTLHAAAYQALGLDWRYDAIEVASDGLPTFLDSLDATWRGLSLTMPLKRTVLPLLDSTDAVAQLTGGANTLLLQSTGGRRTLSGFNTDVYGIEQSLRAAGVHTIDTAHVLGGGATAASVLVALAGLDARRVLVSVRSPNRATELAQLDLGIDVVVRAFGDDDAAFANPDVVVSTLPGHADVDVPFPTAVRTRAVLFDVAYSPWPTTLASRWLETGGTVVPGIDMLIHQAVLQVRIFVSGSVEVPLGDEPAVLSAMSASVRRHPGRGWLGPGPVGGF